MKRGVGGLAVVVVLFLLLALGVGVSCVSATADVAYIYKNKLAIDSNIINTFSQMNLSVDKIVEKNVPTTNFSKYKFIFVGDERFSYPNKIPVNMVPSVVSNYYYGLNWGLTDRDGISKLASTSDLNVRLISDGIRPVYTKAVEGLIAIPYYYLDDENKAPGMQSIARTYTGNPLSDFGDVIAYAPVNTLLKNGNLSKGKTCFFGIIKTKYWTADAKNFFIDCVNYVGNSCSSDLDCAPQQTGNGYCNGNNIYQNTETYSCQNPGTVKSQCVENVIPNLIENCSDGNSRTIDSCYESNGTAQCRHEPIACFNSLECGTDNFIGNSSCGGNSGKDIFRNFQTFTCNNPGTTGSFCSNSTQAVFNRTCLDFCDSGECKTIVCTNNSQCNDGIIRTEDICINPGTINSRCENKEITCFNNLECGVNFLSDSTCLGLNIVKNFQNFTCNNPGTSGSFCTNNSGMIDVQTCSQSCSAGKCQMINCSKNSDCDDSNSYTLDRCNNQGTPSSYCSNDLVNCLSNADCGFTGFSGSEFCTGKSVFKNFQNSTCFNAGTTESYCNIIGGPRLIQTCSDSCSNGGCVNRPVDCYGDSDCGLSGFDGGGFCVGKNIFQKFINYTCTNPGTTISFCSQTNSSRQINQCSDGCSNGACGIVICHNNSECGINSFIGNPFCNGLSGKDIFRNFQIFTCNNPGTLASSCSIISNPQFIEACAQSCVNGNCQTCSQNSDCGSQSSLLSCAGSNVINTTTTPTCNSGSCSIVTTTSVVQTCANGCTDGKCNNNNNTLCTNPPAGCVNLGGNLVCDLNVSYLKDAVVSYHGAAPKELLEIYRSSAFYGNTEWSYSLFRIDKTNLPATANKVVFSLSYTSSSMMNYEGSGFNGDTYMLNPNQTILSLYRVNSTWDYNSDWVSAPTMGAQILNTTIDFHQACNYYPRCSMISGGSCDYIGLDITNLYNSWNSGNNYGFALRDLIGDNAGPDCRYASGGNYFGSSESATKPKIIYEGACQGTVVCDEDSDCGVGSWLGSAYCNGSNVLRDFGNTKCFNPGTTGSYCGMQNGTNIVQTCLFGCSNGICNNNTLCTNPPANCSVSGHNLVCSPNLTDGDGTWIDNFGSDYYLNYYGHALATYRNQAGSGNILYKFNTINNTASDVILSLKYEATWMSSDSFYPGNPTKDILQVGIVNSAWNKNTVTWGSHPSFGSIYSETTIDQSQATSLCSTVYGSCSSGAGQFIDFNITPIYKLWQSGTPNHGFYIQSKYGDYAYPPGGLQASGNYFDKNAKITYEDVC